MGVQESEGLCNKVAAAFIDFAKSFADDDIPVVKYLYVIPIDSESTGTKQYSNEGFNFIWSKADKKFNIDPIANGMGHGYLTPIPFVKDNAGSIMVYVSEVGSGREIRIDENEEEEEEEEVEDGFAAFMKKEKVNKMTDDDE
jgi:hypothetical protein